MGLFGRFFGQSSPPPPAAPLESREKRIDDLHRLIGLAVCDYKDRTQISDLFIMQVLVFTAAELLEVQEDRDSAVRHIEGVIQKSVEYLKLRPEVVRDYQSPEMSIADVSNVRGLKMIIWAIITAEA